MSQMHRIMKELEQRKNTKYREKMIE